MGDVSFDLFGNPVRAGAGRRGRPAFQVTDRNLNKVKLLLALGWSNDRIANAIDCSLATLKRYFRAELSARDRMRDKMEAERIFQAAEQAAKGNVGAMRHLGQLVDRSDRMEAERKAAERPKAEPLGKKQLAQIDARSALQRLEDELTQDVLNLDVRH